MLFSDINTHVLFRIPHSHTITHCAITLISLENGCYYQPNNNIIMMLYDTIPMITCGDMHNIIVYMIT